MFLRFLGPKAILDQLLAVLSLREMSALLWLTLNPKPHHGWRGNSARRLAQGFRVF